MLPPVLRAWITWPNVDLFLYCSQIHRYFLSLNANTSSEDISLWRASIFVFNFLLFSQPKMHNPSSKKSSQSSFGLSWGWGSSSISVLPKEEPQNWFNFNFKILVCCWTPQVLLLSSLGLGTLQAHFFSTTAPVRKQREKKYKRVYYHWDYTNSIKRKKSWGWELEKQPFLLRDGSKWKVKAIMEAPIT